MKLLKLVFIGLVALSLLSLVGCGKSEEQPAEEPEQEAEMTETAEPAVMVMDHTPAGEEIGMEASDPVCGMAVTVEETTPAVEYDGQVYYFCTAADKDTFAANPEEYLTPSEEGEMTEEMEGEGDTGQ